MLANRVQYFIRSILQSSKLNRENFVNNKKEYNIMNIKNRNHNMIIKRNYIEIVNNKLIINRDYFRTTTIDLDKIEKINIEPGPFKSSRVILKDKTTVKYLDSQTNDKELKQFMGQFNIPVG